MRNEIQMDPAGLKTLQTFRHHGIFIPMGTTSAQDRTSDGKGEFEKEKATGNLGFGSLPVLPHPISPIPISILFHLLLPTFPPFPAQFPPHSHSSPALSIPNESQEFSSFFYLCRTRPNKQIHVGWSGWHRLRASDTGWNKSSNVFIRLFPSSSELFQLTGARDEGARSRLAASIPCLFDISGTNPQGMWRSREKTDVWRGAVTALAAGSPGPAAKPRESLFGCSGGPFS